MSINALHDALTATNLLEDLELEDGFISGETTFAAAGVELSVNVDPDPEQDGREVDVAVMVERTRALLSLSAEDYTRIIGEVAEEVESALAEEGIEKVVDIRADLTPVALIVLPEESGIVLLAPTQLPEGALSVYLDDALEITGIQLQGGEGDEGGCGDDCACGSDEGTDGTVASVGELIASLSSEK